MKLRDIILLKEFAPPSDDSGDDSFNEETLKKLAAQWYNGDEDPRVERTLMAAGWEIGEDEGYDNGGVFVVRAGDEHGKSYLSWPAEDLGLDEGVTEGGNVFAPGIENSPAYKAGFATGKLPVPHPEGTQEYAAYYKGVIDRSTPTLNKGVAEGLDFHRLERLDPQTRRVLTRMADHAEPGSWLSAAESYAMQLGLQHKKEDPRGWEQEVQHFVDLYRQYSGQGVAEDHEDNPVVNAITRRIMVQRPDLLKQYGPVAVGQSINDVADFVGDVDEIGSSDVSGWIRHVEQMLQDNPPEAFGEADDNKKIAGRHDPDEFDQMVLRLKKLAGAGPLKTVYDPKRRVYKNVPTAEQPKK